MSTTAETDTLWEPGDPLYVRPRGVVAGEQHVRQLFQVIVEEEWYVRAFLNAGWDEGSVHCAECLVGWHPNEGRVCWSCNQKAPDHEYRRACHMAPHYETQRDD